MVITSMNGVELALAAASTFLHGCWKFEQPRARAMLRDEERSRADSMSDRLYARRRELLEAVDAFVPPSVPFPPDFAARQAAIRAELELSQAELRVCLLALRVCHEEFAERWWEFSVVAPGGIDAFATSPDDLLRLADQLEQSLDGGDA